MDEGRKIDISIGIIIKSVLVILGLWFLYIIRDILALLFISVIIVAVLDPIVDWMQKKRIPRALGVAIVYVLILVISGVIISFLVPPLIGQIRDFSAQLPEYFQNIQQSFRGIQDFLAASQISFNFQDIFGSFGNNLSGVSSNIFSTTVGVFSGFVSAIVVMSLAFYMLVREDGIKNFAVLLTPEKYRDYAVSSVHRIMEKIGKWMQGELILIIAVAILDSVGLHLLGVPYALALGMLAGLLEIIPYIGPVISAIPGIILGFTISPAAGILTAALYFIVQQLEGNIIVPQVMKKTVGLNPISVILVILVGAKLGGVMGIVLSVPLAATLSVFISDFFQDRKTA